ncbi:TolC family protein [Piscinibacter sakaiensis]|uniref:Copper tolerance protein n=1 Tax=Piscinibacter sakaiensis TaxID=1547922 RepID=A0A0K8P2G6_PISS1|nr:TolC family protein [Piscinibacter sakaiensis]GAP36724.1 copper tolerance protein [Piscinibacter sakaiensis]
MPSLPLPTRSRRGAAPAALALAGLLAGCAALPPDPGLPGIQARVAERLGRPVELVRADGPAALEGIARRVDELLAAPLDADAAVQVALLNHRGLQADLAGLGVTEAEVLQAGRLPNPGVRFGRSTRGAEREIERSLHLDLARLLARPLVLRAEARRLDAARARVAGQVLALATDTRKAWVQAVAAEEGLRYARQVMQAAEAAAELARRMAQVGNFSRLQQAREQAFQAEAALGLVRAAQQQQAARERLVRQLGLWGAQTAFRLPERLPELPAQPLEAPGLEQTALAQRLDVQAARATTEATAQQLARVRGNRFVEVLDLGLLRNGASGAPVQRGWEIGLELPLFDDGAARVARAAALHEQALHEAAQAAIAARSEVREAYGAYRAAWDIARHHRDELLPLRARIAEENLLRYNGMLIGVFELLADARAQIAGVQAAIDALRDFWLAQADLDRALVGAPRPTAALVAPADAAAPAAAAH